MCFRNCWYAAIFESQANNPKIKTGETVSRFELNSSVKQPFRGESLLENQKINWEGVILDQKIEISELQPSIQPALQGQMQVDTLTGNVETRKSGNPDHPEIGKSEIN